MFTINENRFQAVSPILFLCYSCRVPYRQKPWRFFVFFDLRENKHFTIDNTTIKSVNDLSCNDDVSKSIPVYTRYSEISPSIYYSPRRETFHSQFFKGLSYSKWLVNYIVHQDCNVYFLIIYTLYQHSLVFFQCRCFTL